MLCRATNALISVRLIYNNLRKKYRNFCFFYFVRLFIFDSFPPFNPHFVSINPLFIPLKHWSPWVYTTKEYRQNMLRWKRHNRSAYTNNSTVEVKVIGGLFIFFLCSLLPVTPFRSKWRTAAFAPSVVALLFFSKFSFSRNTSP